MHPIAPRTLLILAGIVGLTVALQARSFFIAHVTGDQRLYVGLAMKLRRHGFGSYNLRQEVDALAEGIREVARFFGRAAHS